MPEGRHRPPRDPTPGLWILLVLVMAGAAAVYNARHDLLDFLGLTDAPAPAPAVERERLVIHLGGGVLLDPERVPGVEDPGGAVWEGLGPTLRRDDLTVVHLPCALTDDPGAGDRCDPAALPALREVGVEVAVPASDDGASLAHLEAADILAAGPEPAVVETGGWRVAVLAFTGEGDDLPAMVGAVERARANGDVVLVTLRWDLPEDGPASGHVERAEALIEAGADAVVGHTPGVLHRMDRHGGRPIFWSVDSLLRPARPRDGDVDSALARVVVTPEGSVRGRLAPISIRPPGHPVLRGL